MGGRIGATLASCITPLNVRREEEAVVPSLTILAGTGTIVGEDADIAAEDDADLLSIFTADASAMRLLSDRARLPY